MIYVLWEFIVPPVHRAAFEAAYKPDGVWATLFRRDPAYHETVLIQDSEQVGRYLTVDVWEDKDSYLRFKDRFASEYERIDEECEELTASERRVGIFDQIR